MIVAIEGIDASGKRTQAQMLKNKADKYGIKSAIISFPRYRETLFSESVAEYLNGGFGSLDSVSPYFAALLFAGDRFESRPYLMELMNSHDLVILDRYVSSNLAYQAARIGDERKVDFINWLSRIEYEIYNLPKADLTIWLEVPLAIVSKLLLNRPQKDYTSEKIDIHEREISYLNTCNKVYRMLCAKDHYSAWRNVNCLDSKGDLCAPSQISDELWEIVATMRQTEE